MKKTSAGVIISDGTHILIGHATGRSIKNGYDIFKGCIMFGLERPRKAALRELKEESGIKLQAKFLQDLGRFDYRPNKNLHLFLYNSWDVKKEFPLENLKCTSYIPFKGIPEMDRYMYCPINQMGKYLYKSLYPVIKGIIGEK